MKLFSSLALAAVALIAPSGRAALNPALVPADAQWVVYADLSALRSTALGKELIALAEKAQAQSSAKIGVDVSKVLATVGKVTGYGTTFSPDPNQLDGTLIIQGTPDLRKIAESLLLQATIASPEIAAESKDLPFPSYTLHPKGNGKGPDTPVIVAFPPEPVVLVSKSRPQILRARDVFRGEAPPAGKSGSSRLGRLLENSERAYAFVASVVPSDTLFPENQPQARILKMTNSGSIMIGENGGNTFASARLLATSDDMADKLMKILQGMTAMLSLAESNDKQIAEFLSSAAVARDDRIVTLDLSYSSERLAEMVRTLAQKTIERTPEQVAAARAATMINGTPIAEWKATPAPATPEAGTPAPAVATRLIENIELKNGTVISLGTQSNGGKRGRFDHIEITPVGGGAPLTFRPEFMRQGGPRGNLMLLSFPGTDGTYNISVSYVNDPDGKATYAVSVRQPKAAPTRPDAASTEKKS